MKALKPCMQTGHLYQMATGEAVFVPLGATRRDVPKECGKLRFLGVAIRQSSGWGPNGLPPQPRLVA